jgi:hypothetical protein
VRNIGGRDRRQTDFGIGAKWTKAAAHTCGACKAAVEHGNAVNPAVPDAHIRDLRINAIESEWLK